MYVHPVFTHYYKRHAIYAKCKMSQRSLSKKTFSILFCQSLLLLLGCLLLLPLSRATGTSVVRLNLLALALLSGLEVLG